MLVNNRVVITGIGVVSSIGIGKDEFWKNLIAGKSGISAIERFDTSQFPTHRGGEIKNFNPAQFMPASFHKKIGRGSQMAIAATKLALDDAVLNTKYDGFDNMGVIIGTTMGEIPSLEMADRVWIQKGEDEIYSSNVTKYPVNNLSNNVSYFFNFSGINYVIPTACAAGNYSVGYAFDLIQTGRNDLILAGGVDPLSRIAFTGFNRLFAVSPDKCRPFDKNRKGMMVGEGAGILVIEELESALKRKANIYGEVLGYALTCDAHHMTAPAVEGIVEVMKRAMKHSGVSADDVDYVSAHGTGTPANDKAECAAAKEVFKERYKKVPMNSIKSMLGHTMGAASAIEAITCALAIKNSIVPPTINYEIPDPECDIDCVPNESRYREVNIALNNSLAFGGNNACLVLCKYTR